MTKKVKELAEKIEQEKEREPLKAAPEELSELLIAPQIVEQLDFEENLIKIAESWIGTPWQHNQCKKHVGVDCVQFLQSVARASGYYLPEIPARYGKVARDNSIEIFLNQNFIKKNNKKIRRTNILLFCFQGYNNHVAIAVDTKTIVHASFKEKKVVKQALDPTLIRILKGVWTLR